MSTGSGKVFVGCGWSITPEECWSFCDPSEWKISVPPEMEVQWSHLLADGMTSPELEIDHLAKTVNGIPLRDIYFAWCAANPEIKPDFIVEAAYAQ